MISFTSTSTGKINSYSWSFDDQGATSSSKNPSHNFPSDAGNFAVRLEVAGPGGHDSIIKTVPVCS